MSEQQVKDILEAYGYDFDEFIGFMIGQTVGQDNDGNTIYFEHDVLNFIRNREKEQTYFD